MAPSPGLVLTKEIGLEELPQDQDLHRLTTEPDQSKHAALIQQEERAHPSSRVSTIDLWVLDVMRVT